MRTKNLLVDWTFNDLWRATGSSLARKSAVVAGMLIGLLLGPLLIGLASGGMVALMVTALMHLS